jgi:hypothetical protein
MRRDRSDIVAFGARAIILATMSSRSAAGGARTPLAIHEEEALDLPPLDGALDERDDRRDADDVEIGEETDGGGDDQSASDLDAGVMLDVVDERGTDEGDAAALAPLDVGSFADAFVLSEDGGSASDAKGMTLDTEDESPFDASAEDEAGAGTGEDPAAFVDESALPPLDADDGRGAESPEIPGGAARAAASRSAGNRARWRVASGMGAHIPCSLVAVSPAHVVAAGRTVLVARGGARVSNGVGPDVDAVAVAATDDAIFVASRRGALFASMDGGESWATGSVPWPPARAKLALAATPGRLWICENGALWSVRWAGNGRPEPPVLVRKDGVRAMAAADSTLVILAERGADLAVERLRGDDEAPPAELVSGAVRAAIGKASPLLASAAGGRVLGVLAGGTLYVSRDAGRSYGACPAGSAIALAFAGDRDDARALVLTTSAERGRDAPLYLTELGDGDVSTRAAEVALVSGEYDRAAAIGWDAAREVMWVACSAGLLAFERPAQH